MTSVREDLSEEECHALLGATWRGHLAFTRDALPAIAPVRYAVDGDRVVIPAHPDSDHLVPAGGAVVVLGIDDDRASSPWSVTVVGLARTVTDPADVAVCDALAWTQPSVPGDGHCYVVLEAGVFRGWRMLPVSVADPRRWA